MAYWAVARIRPRREELATNRLEAAGFEVFAPKTAHGPLFPSYLFVRIVDRWWRVDRTLGVLGLIKSGEIPAKCPDAEIAKIQSQIDARGLVRLSTLPRRKTIPAGARVRITGGLTGLYAGQTAQERELVLIELLGRQVPVKLQPGQIIELVELRVA